MDYPNMSYCMFQNTYAALEQIMSVADTGLVDVLEDASKDEQRAARDLYALCQEYIQAMEEYEDEIQEY